MLSTPIRLDGLGSEPSIATAVHELNWCALAFCGTELDAVGEAELAILLRELEQARRHDLERGVEEVDLDAHVERCQARIGGFADFAAEMLATHGRAIIRRSRTLEFPC